MEQANDKKIEIIHITHTYHTEKDDAYIILDPNHCYEYIERVIARLQNIHSEENGNYKTEDLSGKQMAYTLNLLLGLKIVSKDNLPDHHNITSLDLFDNWENVVMELGTDEENRKAGKPPYFKPDVVFSDYELPNMRAFLKEMDNDFYGIKE